VRPVDRYEAFLLDLDGVLYRGDEPVPGAVETMAELRDAGRRSVFMTNNSWRTPGQVAEKLEAMGITATAEDVVTSAQATAAVVARESGSDGTIVYVLGGEGIRSALQEAGIDTVDGEPDQVGFVVVGWDRDLTYDRLRTATVLVGRGARLVATNADASYPAPGGEQWPGAGALLAAVETGSGRRATVVGKPHRPLFDLATERAGTRNVLVVGDRIETDIAGAAATDLDAALVLTGAATPADLMAADVQPDLVMDDVRGLLEDLVDAAIRPAASGDEPDVQRLLHEAGLGPHDGGSWERPPTTVVAAEGNSVVATAAVDVVGTDAYLRSVAVREDLRAGRLGTRIVAAAVRDARHRGALRVWLVTETAASFFDRLGFDRIDRTSLPGWMAEHSDRCGASAVTMRRDLDQ
jgi:phosphoglycolate/pyridoxal phosphate phosphatase family enzyme